MQYILLHCVIAWVFSLNCRLVICMVVALTDGFGYVPFNGDWCNDVLI